MMIKTLFLLSFLFFIYSFIGWILEVVQSAFHQKRLVNRGFINSPLCISYGIGAIVITINTHQMTGLWIFAAAMIDATVIEWFGGHFIEHFYHERWWDYSKNKWNLDGYICLSHSVFWGLLGYIGVKFVNPLLFKFYHLIPPFIRHLIIFILLAVLIIDILATTIVVFGKNIDKRRWESADAYLTKISVKLSSLITSYVDRRVERAYPQRKLKLPTIPKTGVFAQGCGFYKVFLLFSIGSLLGDIIETRACKRSDASNCVGGKCTLAAMNLAQLCYDTLMENGVQAMIAAKEGICTKAVENVIEANTYLSGIGFESGGLAGAHAIHNGFTAIPETHKMYHGEKVAFGTLVQLVLEDAGEDEIMEVIDFCSEIGLPVTLKGLGIEEVKPEQIMEVARLACAPDDTMGNMPFDVESEDLYAAIMGADALGRYYTEE